MLSDEALVEGFQRGDDGSFDAIFERYRRPIYAFFYRVVGDKNEAMDLVQETFLSVYKALDRWQPRAKFSTWLFTVATNKVRTYLSRKQRRIVDYSMEILPGLGEESYRLEIADLRPGPEECYSAERAEEALMDAVMDLPSQQRKVFVLRHTHEMKLSEIAEVLGIAEGTVKVHLFKAVGSIRKRFEALGLARDEGRRLGGSADE